MYAIRSYYATDGTIKDMEVKYTNYQQFRIQKILVEVECLTPVLYFKEGVKQKPEIRMTNKVGTDDITVDIAGEGKDMVGDHQGRVIISGNDAKQYYTDYYDGGNTYVKVYFKIVGLEFTGSITPNVSPVYGDTWNDILIV